MNVLANEAYEQVQSAEYFADYNGVDYSAVLDTDYYADHNPDLKAAFGYDSEALTEHFVKYGMSEGRQACADFNVSYYKLNYADLVQAFGDDNAAYYMHYINYGRSEGRTADSLTENAAIYKVFSAEYYAEHNADLKAAFGTDSDKLLNHFITYGMSEGRQAAADFNVNCYISNYEDLRNAFGTDTSKYYTHYMNYGASEGRNAAVNTVDYSAVFDALYYAQNNSDVAAVYGSDETALLKHFLIYGMKEAREADEEFNVTYYKENYPDLRKAFGDDLISYYMHYISYGKAEGRNAAYSDPQVATVTKKIIYYDCNGDVYLIDTITYEVDDNGNPVEPTYYSGSAGYFGNVPGDSSDNPIIGWYVGTVKSQDYVYNYHLDVSEYPGDIVMTPYRLKD
jgi:hypothetical protein